MNKLATITIILTAREPLGGAARSCRGRVLPDAYQVDLELYLESMKSSVVLDQSMEKTGHR